VPTSLSNLLGTAVTHSPKGYALGPPVDLWVFGVAAAMVGFFAEIGYARARWGELRPRLVDQ